MSVSQPDIYIGLWTDWTQGSRATGATITLSSRYSIFPTNLLAVFIPLVGVQCWKIFCFCAHQARVSEGPRDALHHQLEVVLQNSSSPDSTAFTFLKEAWHWRKQSWASADRCLRWSLLAVVWALVFAALGIVLPIAVAGRTGDLRQIARNTCGYYIPGQDASSINDFNAKTLNDSITAAQYVTDCYVEKPDRALCEEYACQNFSDSEAYQIDSGYIDSLDDLGINFPPEERLKYRKMTTCAMLNDAGSYSQSDELGTSFYYGNLSSGANATFYQYDLLSAVGSLGYRLEPTLTADTGTFITSKSEYTSWSPIDELQSDDADLTIFFLASQSMTFTVPVDDPWFSAHELLEVPGFDNVYQADRLGCAMACKDQHQICNPQTRTCTSLTHSLALRDERRSPRLALSDTQLLIASRLVYASSTGWISYSVEGRGSSALQASWTTSNYRQAALPCHQWQREVDGWYDVSLARLQKNIRDFVTGPALGGQNTAPQLVLLENAREMCEVQTVRITAGTTDFSALGVLLIFCVGGVVIVLGYTLDAIIGFIQVHSGKGRHRRIAWIISDKLHLRHMVLQRAGVAEWQNRDGSVPWTAENRSFVVQPGADLKDQPDVDHVLVTE